MNELKLYALKDTLTGAFGGVTVSFNNATCIRSLQGMKLPNVKDMQLYCLGSYNQLTGEIVPCVEFVGNLVEWIEVEQ